MASFPTVSLKDAATGKRVRVSSFAPGAALVPVVKPEPILGYCHHAGHLTVYVNGSMPLAMRSAQEQGHAEAWLVSCLPASRKSTSPTAGRSSACSKLPSPALHFAKLFDFAGPEQPQGQLLMELIAGELGGVSGAGGGILVAVEHLVDIVEVGAGLSLGAPALFVLVLG